MKQCCRCRESKPLDQFKRNRTTPDGLHRECKTCCKVRYEANAEKNRAYAREYYWRNPEHYRERAKLQRQTPEHQEAERRRAEARAGRLPENPTPGELRARDWYLRYRAENAERHRENSRRWVAANRDDYNAYARAKKVTYRVANPERWKTIDREASRRRRAADPVGTRDQERRNLARWRAAHPEENLATKHRRRARAVAASGRFTAGEWRALKAKYGFRCLCCGKVEPEVKVTADHVIPLASGGGNGIDNIQPLCGPCNSRKGLATTDYRPPAR